MEDRDQLARQAAALFVAGKAASVAEAIRMVAPFSDSRGTPSPSHGRVRAHIRGMTLQAMGQAEYAASIRAVWDAAEQLMTLLEESPLEVTTSLMGRSARGEFDGEFRVHIRMRTRAAVDQIAALLEEAGYGEISIRTVSTRYGRLNRIGLIDDDLEFILTRCPPDLRIDEKRSVFNESPVASANLDELRAKLDRTN